MFGASHQSALSAPPPPRFVGAVPARVCARATPAEASISAASGVVTLSPTMVWTNPRRERRPVRT